MPRQARGSRRTTQPQTSTQEKQQQQPLFFWRETEGAGGFLAPWYASPFTEGNRTFTSVGHWVTAEKAKLFGDQAALKRILATRDTDKHRAIGRNIKNFNEPVWKRECYRLAVRANFLKFNSPSRENRSGIRDRLLRTGNRQLVNASPYDRLWGVGLKAADAKRAERGEWGENLYGKAVMEVRRDLEWKSNPDSSAAFDTPGSGLNINW